MLLKSSIRLLILAIFYFFYLIIGAAIFSSIELPTESITKNLLREKRKEFLDEHSACLTEHDLEKFIEKIVEAQNRGVSALRNATGESNWSFGQSLFFATTILTTIGYGHVTPLSEGGKFFCIVYALFGIPMTLILLTALVERLMILTGYLFNWLNNRWSHTLSLFQVRLIHVAIVFSFLLVFIFIIPASIFMHIEQKWNFLDSLYYCFISMTTIGLGDYIPGDQFGQKNRILYKIITTIYLLIGIIIMMLTIATVYEVPELNIGSHFYLQSDISGLTGHPELDHTEIDGIHENKKDYNSTTAEHPIESTPNVLTGRENQGLIE